jgi:hypothetical protein
MISELYHFIFSYNGIIISVDFFALLISAFAFLNHWDSMAYVLLAFASAGFGVIIGSEITERKYNGT